jgi:hypothetical protein
MLKAIVTFIYKEIDMVTNNEIGELEIINLPRLHHLELNLKILKKLMQYKLMWLASVVVIFGYNIHMGITV